MRIKIKMGSKTEHVDMDTGSLSLREAVAVQEEIGADEWDDVARGVMRPKAFQAIVLAKLRTKYPDIGPDDFDLDYIAAPEEVDDTEEVPTEAS